MCLEVARGNLNLLNVRFNPLALLHASLASPQGGAEGSGIEAWQTDPYSGPWAVLRKEIPASGPGHTSALLTTLHSRRITFLSPCFLSWFCLMLISLLVMPLFPFNASPPTPNCSNIISPPSCHLLPPFLLFFILSLPVSWDSICAECCVCAYLWTHRDWDTLKSSLI